MAQDDDDGILDWLDDLVGEDGAGFLDGNNTIFYPWVANDDDFGLGAADTSISVQNLEDEDTTIYIYVGNGEGGFDLVTSAFLSAFAAKTFTAEMLGIAEGDGAPVMVAAFEEVDLSAFPDEAGVPEGALDDLPSGTVALVETPVILSNPITADDDGGETTQVVACVVNYHTASQPGLGQPWGYVAAVDHTFVGEEGDVDLVAGEWFTHPFTQQELQDTLDLANADEPVELINPFGGLNNDGDCFDVIEADDLVLLDSVAIGGVALQTAEAGVPGNGDDDDDDDNGDDNGAETMQISTSSDTSVSGYNAVNGIEISRFNEWYLPIVQTNGGPGGKWNSIIRVGNFSGENNAVTVRFFPADDGSGSLQTGFQVQQLVNGGDTLHIDLSDYVPEDWVGSAHILSDGAVFAMVDRYKVGTSMWITNTGSSADFENVAQIDGANGRYALFAPHVLLDYFGWNTGINVANLSDSDNNVSIQYFNLLGNATEVFNQRLAAHGMTYFYDPSIPAQDGGQDVTSDANASIVGSAIIWSESPVAAAVDATKYPETDPNGGADVGHATSYNATANVFPWQAVPYVTKGNPTDGSGATSGINIMNPNATATTAEVFWVNPSGFQGSNFGTSSVTIPGFANGFVYTLWQQNLPNGFLGAAQVIADQPVAAASANVNYDVDGDGSAIFNAFNPCGLYRAAGPCTFGDVFEPGGQSVTKYFIADDGEDDDVVDGDDVPVAGVNFSIIQTSGGNYQRDGVSQIDGSAIFTNVPVGTYELVINSVPEGYEVDADFEETFVVNEGEDVVLVNRLGVIDDGVDIGDLTVTVVDLDPAAVEGASLAQANVGDDDDVVAGEAISGVVVNLYAGTDTEVEPVQTGTTGEDGSYTFEEVEDGDYTICLDIEASTDANIAGEPVDLSLTEGDVTVEDCVAYTEDDADDNGDDNGATPQQNGDDADDDSVVLGVFATPADDGNGDGDGVGSLAVTTALIIDAEEVPTGAAVAVYEGACPVADDATSVDSGDSGDAGLITFTDLAPGDYCVTADFGDGITGEADATVVADTETPVTVVPDAPAI